MNASESERSLRSLAGRLALWGSAIVGIAGIVLGVNAALSDEFVGAGLCLVASALAFGAIGLVFFRD